MATDPIFTTLGQLDDTMIEAIRESKDSRLLTNWLVWNVWSRKQSPYDDLQEGQTVYWFDKKAREISVEMRVASIGREHFADKADAYRTMDKVYGLSSEVTDRAFEGGREAPEAGYLFVVAIDPVAYIGIPLDIHMGKVGGTNGWASYRTILDSEHVSDEAKETIRSLPAEGRPTITKSDPIDLGAIKNLADLPRAPRMPTAANTKAATERAGGKCELEECSGNAEHLDHKYPWAHGGNSDAVNLQWLCAEHNLKKSDKIPDEYTLDQLWIRFLTNFDDDHVTLEANLKALEIRTRNSVYDVVIDDDIFISWKRGSRSAYVDQYTTEDDLLVEGGNGKPGKALLAEGGGIYFSSSRVESVNRKVDPIAALARIGKKPGDRIDMMHAHPRLEEDELEEFRKVRLAAGPHPARMPHSASKAA